MWAGWECQTASRLLQSSTRLSEDMPLLACMASCKCRGSRGCADPLGDLHALVTGPNVLAIDTLQGRYLTRFGQSVLKGGAYCVCVCVCVSCVAGALALLMAVDPRRVQKYNLLTNTSDVAAALLHSDQPSPASTVSNTSSTLDNAAGVSSSTGQHWAGLGWVKWGGRTRGTAVFSTTGALHSCW